MIIGLWKREETREWEGVGGWCVRSTVEVWSWECEERRGGGRLAGRDGERGTREERERTGHRGMGKGARETTRSEGREAFGAEEGATLFGVGRRRVGQEPRVEELLVFICFSVVLFIYYYI